MNTRQFKYVPRHLLGSGILIFALIPGLLITSFWAAINIVAAMELSYTTAMCGLVTGKSALTAVETGLLIVGAPTVLWLLYIRSRWSIKKLLPLGEGKTLRCWPGYTAVYGERLETAGWIHNGSRKDHIYTGPGNIEYITADSLTIRYRREKLWFISFFLAGPLQCVAVAAVYLRFVLHESPALGFGYEAITIHRAYGLALVSILITTAAPLIIVTAIKHAKATWWPRATRYDYAPIFTALPTFTFVFSRFRIVTASSMQAEALHSIFFIFAGTAAVWGIWKVLPRR